MRQPELLERAAEQAALRRAVDAAKAGLSGFIVLSGPAGSGKSQLLVWARQLASQAGLWVLTGRGSALEREYAFGLVRQLLESTPNAGGDDWPGWPPATGPGRSRPGQGEFAVLQDLFWLVANLCQDGPGALIIDDLQWADEPSLRFLAFLQPRLEALGLIVITALRPGERRAATQLLDVIAGDSSCEFLQLAPLSAQAVTELLAAAFPQPVDAKFADTCWRATGGNPLLLAELTRALLADGLSPTGDHVDKVERIGAQALTRRVSYQLSQLSTADVQLTEALSVLAPRASLGHAAQLAGLPMQAATRGIGRLESVHLIQPAQRGLPGAGHDFVHPLVQAAVYDQIAAGRRAQYHRRAAFLLQAEVAPAEQIAAHLLHVPPDGDAVTLAILRAAAAEAASDSPEAALTYLRRALAEPPPADQVLAVLTEAAHAALRVDLPAAVDYLTRVLARTADVEAQARLSGPLAIALLQTGGAEQMVNVITDAVSRLPPGDDLTRSLQAVLVIAPLSAVGWGELYDQVEKLRALPPEDTLGAAMLDCALGGMDCFAADPRMLDRVRRAVTDRRLIELTARGWGVGTMGYLTLIYADPAEGVDVTGKFLALAQDEGSLGSLCACYGYRGLGWLRCGELSEAETDLREALRLAWTVGMPFGVTINAAFLADALIEQGRLDDAESVLRQVEAPELPPAEGLFFHYQHAQAQLRYAQGRYREGLVAALAAGQRFAGHCGTNPAVIPWRSTAAQCLHVLGDETAAIEHVRTELELARRWGSPGPIGRCLRVHGTLIGGTRGTELLREAVEVLEPAPLRLEYAKALVELGSALRRGHARHEARQHLAAGLDLADKCGARPLAERARNELRAAGARPRRNSLTGSQALTPSERRIAELATRGFTNRDIARQLFITNKTVETHMANIFHKLGASRRNEIATRLQA